MIEDNFVEKIIRRSNRNTLLLSLFGIAIVVIGVAVSSRYLSNFFSGPYDLTSADVLAIDNVKDTEQYFVHVTGEDSYDTGYQLFNVADNGKKTIEANYAALAFGDRLLMVKTKADLGDNPPLNFTGELVSMPGDVQREVIADIEQEVPELKGAFLPYMLDTHNFRTPGYIGLAIGGVILLISLWGLSMAVRRSNPSRHPIMQSLERFGDASKAANEINYEVNGALRHKHKKMKITKNWLLLNTASSLNATRFNDVMWLYQKVTQHKRNGIPTGKTFEVMVWDRYGKSIIINTNKNEVEGLMKLIYERVPWVLVGYDEQLNKAWKSERNQIIEAVDNRHKQFLEQRQSA